MENYRLFFLDNESHIWEVLIIEAEDDEAARSEAARLFNNQQKFESAELWQLKRRVAVLTNRRQ
jgi:hypothetical protein